MALERYYSLFFFPYLKPIVGTLGGYWVLSREERNQGRMGDKLYALILCSSAVEQSKPTYSLRRHLTGFRFSEQLSEMITDIFFG